MPKVDINPRNLFSRGPILAQENDATTSQGTTCDPCDIGGLTLPNLNMIDLEKLMGDVCPRSIDDVYLKNMEETECSSGIEQLIHDVCPKSINTPVIEKSLVQPFPFNKVSEIFNDCDVKNWTPIENTINVHNRSCMRNFDSNNFLFNTDSSSSDSSLHLHTPPDFLHVKNEIAMNPPSCDDSEVPTHPANDAGIVKNSDDNLGINRDLNYLSTNHIIDMSLLNENELSKTTDDHNSCYPVLNDELEQNDTGPQFNLDDLQQINDEAVKDTQNQSSFNTTLASLIKEYDIDITVDDFNDQVNSFINKDDPMPSQECSSTAINAMPSEQDTIKDNKSFIIEEKHAFEAAHNQNYVIQPGQQNLTFKKSNCNIQYCIPAQKPVQINLTLQHLPSDKIVINTSMANKSAIYDTNPSSKSSSIFKDISCSTTKNIYDKLPQFKIITKESLNSISKMSHASSSKGPTIKIKKFVIPSRRINYVNENASTSQASDLIQSSPASGSSKVITTRNVTKRSIDSVNEDHDVESAQLSSDDEDDDDYEEEFERPNRRKRPKISLSGLSDGDKYKRIREQNNAASKICREKKKIKEESIIQSVKDEETRNTILRHEYEKLVEEVRKWKLKLKMPKRKL